MKCRQCKFENSSNAKICIKCGTKLLKGPASIDEPSASGQPTVVGRQGNQKGSSRPKSDLISCPHCFFTPLKTVPDVANPCPNCGKPETVEKENYVNLKKQNSPNRTMSLKDLAIHDEKLKSEPVIKLIGVHDSKELDFTGTEIELKRADLDSENMALSSKGHVKFIFKDGRWSIQDISSNGSTFVQVPTKTEINSDQHIILGGKIYRVKFD